MSYGGPAQQPNKQPNKQPNQQAEPASPSDLKLPPAPVKTGPVRAEPVVAGTPVKDELVKQLRELQAAGVQAWTNEGFARHKVEAYSKGIDKIIKKLDDMATGSTPYSANTLKMQMQLAGNLDRDFWLMVGDRNARTIGVKFEDLAAEYSGAISAREERDQVRRKAANDAEVEQLRVSLPEEVLKAYGTEVPSATGGKMYKVTAGNSMIFVRKASTGGYEWIEHDNNIAHKGTWRPTTVTPVEVAQTANATPAAVEAKKKGLKPATRLQEFPSEALYLTGVCGYLNSIPTKDLVDLREIRNNCDIKSRARETLKHTAEGMNVLSDLSDAVLVKDNLYRVTRGSYNLEFQRDFNQQGQWQYRFPTNSTALSNKWNDCYSLPYPDERSGGTPKEKLNMLVYTLSKSDRGATFAEDIRNAAKKGEVNAALNLHKLRGEDIMGGLLEAKKVGKDEYEYNTSFGAIARYRLNDQNGRWEWKDVSNNTGWLDVDPAHRFPNPATGSLRRKYESLNQVARWLHELNVAKEEVQSGSSR